MMDSFTSQLAGSGLVALLIGAVLLYLRDRDHAPYMDCWARAFFASAIRQVAAIFTALNGPHVAADLIMHLAILVEGLLLLRGTYQFLGRDVPKRWLYVAATVGAWTMAAPFLNVGFLATTLPLFAFRGMSDLVAAHSLLSKNDRQIGALVAGIAFLLWGIHRLNYPFLRPVPWFAPWGFMLAAFFGVAVGVGLLMMHYEKARRELAQQEEEFRSLFENALDGYFRADHAGVLLNVNPAFAAMLERPAEQLIGKNLEEFTSQTAPWTDTNLDGLEQTWRRPDGRPVHVLLRVRELQRKGQTYFEGSVRDISQTRMMQEQLDLARRMDALGRLAGGIAHDFNNILTAIMGGVDLAEMELADGTSPQANLAIIRLSARKAAELAAQLLAFTKQRQGEASPVRIDTAISNTEAMLRRLLPEHVHLIVRKDGGTAHCLAEPGQIERIVLNLAVNAQDAMPRGGTLEIETQTDAERTHATLIVRDSGQGMDPDILQQIFEPFFSTKLDRGTGLGLANVYKIVESLGGAISVKSAIGHGSEFRVKLPIVDTAVGLEHTFETPLPTVDGSPLVLLVEDRDFVRRSTQRILERSGYRVLATRDGAEALQVAQSKLDTIDVVLSDVMMPRKSGPELIHELRLLRPALPCVLMSAHTEEDLSDELAANFLAKPFTAVELILKLENARSRAHSTTSSARRF